MNQYTGIYRRCELLFIRNELERFGLQPLEGKVLNFLRRGSCTQEDVCARMAQLGRPMLQSAYSQIETGRRNLFVSDPIALRTVLNAQYDDFFRGLVPIDRYKDETQT